MALRERVKECREKKNWNQKQLADASGITQATISRIESGDVVQLKSESLRKVAGALGVTVDYLVGKTDKLSPNDVVGSDPTAKHVFRGYERLSATEREQVKNFVDFLEKQDKRKGKNKR
jgi:transcriptional regulator with XRE-family HTH domain